MSKPHYTYRWRDGSIIKSQSVSSPASSYLTSLGMGATMSGVNVNAVTAMQLNAVFACVYVLASDVAKLPVMVFKRSGREGRDRQPITDHPAYRVLHSRPNHWQTRTTYREMLMTSLLLRGNGYSLKDYDSRGRLIAVYPWHPDKVYPQIAFDGSWFYSLSASNELESALLNRFSRTISAEDVMHIRGLTLDGYMGVSPITYQRETLGLAMATENHAAKLFSNAARPGGVLTHPHTLSPEAQERLRKTWSSNYSGIENAWRVAILEEGMQFQPMTMTSQDAEFLGQRQLSTTQILGIFRVPPHKIGILTDATRSNIESQALEYVTDSLMHWLERLEASYERDLLTEEEQSQGFFIEHNVMRLLRGDIKSRYEAFSKGRQWGWLSVNDIREMENMPLIEDGGDEYLTPLNMMPIGESADSQSQARMAAAIQAGVKAYLSSQSFH